MLLLNFSHPITPVMTAQVEALTGATVERIVDLPTQFDEQQPFAPQVRALVERVGLSSVAWQTLPMVVALPSLNFIAAALLAELHGRMGYFPPVLRTRPLPNHVPRGYEVAEILDLQALRDDARRQR